MNNGTMLDKLLAIQVVKEILVTLGHRALSGLQVVRVL